MSEARVNSRVGMETGLYLSPTAFSATTNIWGCSRSHRRYLSSLKMVDKLYTTTHYPKPDDVTGCWQRGFKVTARRLPILKAGPIEEMTSKLGINPPEMIFGDNIVSIEHAHSNWAINFNAFDALDRVDKTGQRRLTVAYSKEWQKNRYCPVTFRAAGLG